jgi:hypothetical protein
MTERMWWIVYFAMYWSAGFTLKAGDDFLDELNRPGLAWFPLTLSGLLFGLIMTLSQWDMVLLSAILIGVVLTGKVNRPQFVVGFLMIGILLVIRGVPLVTDWFDWWSLLLMLLFAAAIDEVGHEGVGRAKGSRDSWFFKYRFTLKCSVLLLCILWPSFLPSAVGLWFFDLGYEIAGRLTKARRSVSLDTQDYSKRP